MTKSKVFTPSLFIMIILLMMFTTAVSAQKKFKWEGKKLSSVTIVDPGSVYAIYVMSEKELETLTNDFGINEEVKAQIKKYSTEDQWPAKIRTLYSRSNNSETLMKYSAYLIGDFNEKLLLIIPEKSNRQMPDGFIPHCDFFVIIGRNGVKTSVKN